MTSRRIAASIVALACSLFVSLTAIAESHVRIVHLSYIDGDAQVNTGGQAGFTHAVLNMPVTEGMWLYTPNGGRAEVRFENGSTVRVANDSEIQFSKLALADSGGKLETITVDHGIAYFNFDKVDRNDRVLIKVGGKEFTLTKGSRMRVDADKKKIDVALFKGEANIADTTNIALEGGESLRLAANNDTQATMSNDIKKLDADKWNKERDGDVEAVLARNNRTAQQWPDTYTYEMSALGGYGNFFNVPGYGMMWQPFGMGNGWNPYMNGLWGMYPGMGYTWISSEPWGWAPYRYGSWNFVPSYGWAWSPAASFNAWNVGPTFGAVPASFKAPVAPVVSGGVKTAQLVVVGHPTDVHPSILAGKAEVGAHPQVSPVLRASSSSPRNAAGGAHAQPTMMHSSFGSSHMSGSSSNSSNHH